MTPSPIDEHENSAAGSATPPTQLDLAPTGERDTVTGPPGRTRMPEPRVLRQLRATAWMEFRLQARSAEFMVIAVLGLFFASTYTGYALGNWSILTMLNIAISIPLYLYPFVGTRAALRERQRHVIPLALSRPISTFTTITGQWVGSFLLCLGYTSVLYVIVCTKAILAGNQASLVVWAGGLPTIAIAIAVITSWSIAWGYLVPIGTFGALAAVISLVFLNNVHAQTPLQPLNLTLANTVFWPSIGFGPDSGLVGAQMLINLGVALVILVLALLLGRIRRPLGFVPARQWGGVALVGVMGISALVGGSGLLAQIGHQRTTGIAVPPGDELAAVLSYTRLEVHLDPTSGALDGVAQFHLTVTPPGTGPSGTESIKAFWVILNPGLTVTSAQINGEPATITTGLPGWNQLAAQSGARSTFADVRMTYSGRITLERDDYGSVDSGLSFFGSHSVSTSPIPLNAYVGQGLAFLTGGGDWYPRPWVRGEGYRFNSGDPIASVTIHVPANTTALSGAGSFNPASGTGLVGSLPPSGSDQILQVDQPVGTLTPQPLPGAFVVAMVHARRVSVAGSDLVLRGWEPDAAMLNYSAKMVAMAQMLDQEYVGKATHWTGVILPFLLNPLVGNGLLFIPEYEAINYSNANLLSREDYFSSYSSLASPAKAHSAALITAIAWWNAQLAVALPAGLPEYFIATADFFMQGGQSRVIFSLTSTNQVATILAEYSAGIAIAQTQGQGELRNEIAIRQAYFQFRQQEVTSHSQSYGVQAQIDMDRAGLSPVSFDGDPFQAVLALYTLEQQVGEARVQTAIVDYLATHMTVPSDMASFTAALTATTGVDVAPIFAQYAPPILSNEPKPTPVPTTGG